MARRPRRIRRGKLYEVTLKTFQARYFFVPSRWLNLLLVGVLAYCQQRFGLRFCSVTFLSNHAHLLIRADEPDQVRDFFCLANSQISKEAQRICGWTGGIFRRRCSIIEVTDRPEAQIARLEYCLSQGVKEGLCPDPESWPGVQSMKAWLTGSMSLPGVWVNRGELYELERRGRWKIRAVRKILTKAQRKLCESRLTLRLSPLPCWDHLNPKELRREANAMRDRIVERNADQIAKIRPGWRKRLMNPELRTFRPDATAKSDEPRVYASSMEEWQSWVREYDEWWTFYERASMRLRLGIEAALREFPEDCFIPSGVFPRSYDGLPPPAAAA